MQASPYKKEALLQGKSCGYIRGIENTHFSRTTEMDRIKLWIVKTTGTNPDQVILFAHDQVTTLTNERNYPPTRYKENIVEIRIIPNNEHTVLKASDRRNIRSRQRTKAGCGPHLVRTAVPIRRLALIAYDTSWTLPLSSSHRESSTTRPQHSQYSAQI